MATGRCQDIEAVFILYQEQVVCPIVFLVFVTNHTHFYLLFPIRDPLLISCFICDFLAPNCLALCGLLTSPVPLHCSLYSSGCQPFGPHPWLVTAALQNILALTCTCVMRCTCILQQCLDTGSSFFEFYFEKNITNSLHSWPMSPTDKPAKRC